MTVGETGRVAVITGATGGVGAAVARELSRAGYSLVLTAPSMEKLTALASHLKGPCTVIEGSLSDEALPETLLYAALDRFGRCDVCFNNGALYEGGIIETVDIERLSSMVRVNVEGSFRVAYVFVKHFVSEGAGHLVNVSGAVGSSSRPTAYGATQRAIEVLSDALVAELGDGDVLVSCIQPGLVKTGANHRWEIGAGGASGAGHSLEPEDFARMVLFILEHDAGGRAVEESVEQTAPAVDDESAEASEHEAQEKDAESRDLHADKMDAAKMDTENAPEEGSVQDEI